MWTGWLMLRLAKLIPCKHILRILSLMTGTRQSHVIRRGEKGKTRKIGNDVQQGSGIAPTLFNILISDMPETISLQPGYADNWVLTYQSKEWIEIEDTLSKDTTALNEYFYTRNLKMNSTK
ncbi:RNA-directed DNA polymerase from mobile element jockey [Elysia marginata]|uniref:RNA-directed DNA polymerase from mobile element jockey n=1 Tax=Elysia marginata TaxID=1093978 RepID=A0AAV4G8H9_9GAST|nr:RNA-directed DNA polymerase from mobile element jockey [Elysia marginata]